MLPLIGSHRQASRLADFPREEVIHDLLEELILPIRCTFSAIELTSWHVADLYPSSNTMTAIEEAERAGFDLSLIDASLQYTYDKRAFQHQQALDLALELEKVGRQLRGESQSTVPASLRR